MGRASCSYLALVASHSCTLDQYGAIVCTVKKWPPENNYQYVINNIYSRCLQK